VDLDQTTGADTGAMLLELGQAVARAATIDDMIRVVTDVAGPLLGAINATALLMDETRSQLMVHHGPAALTAQVRVVDINDPTPAGHVARTGESVFLENVEELEKINWAALAVLPMREGGELFGVMVFRWKGPVAFTRERRELVSTVTELLAHALARAQNHDRLLAYARRLRESNRDLDCFAAAVAHDLRQPMRQIGSFVDLLLGHLRRDQLDADASHYADRITAAVQRADRLIIALLEYARAGGRPLAEVEIPLDRLTKEVIEVLRLRLEEARATVHHGDLPMVQGDPDLLHQVLQNLIDNAAKYRDPKRPPQIAVSAQPAEREGDDPRPWWRISVQDNGVGIPREHVGKVFDVFTRAQQAADLGGTGIGLATAKRVVERHGGEMGVDSIPGKGSTFWFTLPGVAGRHHY
jgi:signal transduction histidine kinase